MIDAFHDIWLSFLLNLYVRKTLELASLRCPGCRHEPSPLRFPLLHQHNHDSRLQNMEAHQHEIKAFLLSKLEALYERAKPNLPATTEKDRETYLQGARMFLHMSTVPFLYYSKMINENTDELIL